MNTSLVLFDWHICLELTLDEVQDLCRQVDEWEAELDQHVPSPLTRLRAALLEVIEDIDID